MIREIIFILILVCISLSPSGAQNVESVTAYKPVTPVFKNVENNPVIQINVPGDSGSNLTEIALGLEGSTRDIIKNIRVFYTGISEEFKPDNLFGEPSEFGKRPVIKGKQELKEEANFFWVSIELKEETELLDNIYIHSDYIIVDDKQIEPHAKRRNVKLKPGIKLRRQGQDGVDTYRIPGLATTNKGTLIAVYDIRYDNSRDLQADIDIGMSRSTDGGQSWEPMKIIMDINEWGGKPENQNGVGDPAVLIDRETNTIWVAALWAHGYEGERILNATGPGFKPEESGQLLLVKSEDDGKTWSEPINITRQVKKKEWHIVFNGPGKGITMSDGALVFPAQFWDDHGMPFSTIIYSKDHGRTWDIGTGAKSNTTEAQVVELSDGSLMLNMRDNRGGSRSVYTTDDLGKTWSKHPTSRKALREPVCMASLISMKSEKEKGSNSCLLFSNPDSKEARIKMTIKLSADDGMTWPDEHQILLNENGGYGYSCLAAIDEHTVGILYEGVQELYFQKISIKELTEDY